MEQSTLNKSCFTPSLIVFDSNLQKQSNQLFSNTNQTRSSIKKTYFPVGLQIPFTLVTVGFLPGTCVRSLKPLTMKSWEVSTGLPLGLFAHKRSVASLCLSLSSDMGPAIGAAGRVQSTGRRNTIHVAWSLWYHMMSPIRFTWKKKAIPNCRKLACLWMAPCILLGCKGIECFKSKLCMDRKRQG